MQTPTWPQRPQAFSLVLKPHGPICNLDCAYCFYLRKEYLYPDASFRISDELLENYTRQYIDAQRVPQTTFIWQGGEPTLMGLDFYRKAVAYQKKYRKPGMTIENSFQTNGILLDDDWCQFFHENHFLIGLSIDGPRSLHDLYRQDKGGRGTFERVRRAVDLLKKNAVEFNTLTCVHAGNAEHGLEVYRFLRDDLGSRFIQFIPIVEQDNSETPQDARKISPRSVSGPQYGRFLIDVFDEWVRRDVGQVYVQAFDAALAAFTRQKTGLCIFEETCGLGLVMEFNGDVYSCDHFVEPGFFLGNISQQSLGDLAASPTQFEFGQSKLTSLPSYCHSCEVRFACHGGCPKDRLLKTPANETGLNYLCAGYRAFFNYIQPSMKLMTAMQFTQRLPAEVMPILAAIPTLRETPPGSACPCGSGRPVEQCHRAPGGFAPANLPAPPPSKLRSTRKRH
jgi:uncharacterized protein